MHEFLTKPTSPRALHDWLVSIMMKPRPMISLATITCRYVPRQASVVRELARGF